MKRNFEEVIKKYGNDIKVFDFEGTIALQEKDGFPRRIGTYNTVVYGELDKFVPGEEVVDQFVLVYEKYEQGNECVPSTFRTVYAAKHVTPEVNTLLSSN